MRATLHGAALASYAGQFVWLDVNYDDPRNAGFLDHHLSAGYPAVMIIAPATGEVTRMWTGTASPAQLAAFFDGAPARSAAEDAIGRGDARLGRGDAAGAVAAYEEAIAAGGASRVHATEQLVAALQLADNHACMLRAAREAPALPRDHVLVNVALIGVACAAGDRATTDEARQLEALAGEALDAPTASEDDHYQLFEALYALRVRAHDPAGARALAVRYLAYAEQMPAPRSDDERMARDLARLRAALKLGEPARVIPALEASERALPRDDNASARLAAAYTAAHRFIDAIAAATRGLLRLPGPGGAVRLLAARASAAAQAGDPAAARRDLAFAQAAAARIAVASARDQATQQIARALAALP